MSFIYKILNTILETLKSVLIIDKKIIEEKTKPVIIPEVKKEMTNKELFIKTLKDSIGHDMSPDNLAPQELSCAEGMSSIINKVFPDFPKRIIHTVTLFNALKDHRAFKATLIPSAGCVIISPTIKDNHGHVGGMISDTRIVSNSSKSGLMEDNYSLNTWVTTFKTIKGLHVYIFEIVE